MQLAKTQLLKKKSYAYNFLLHIHHTRDFWNVKSYPYCEVNEFSASVMDNFSFSQSVCSRSLEVIIGKNSLDEITPNQL